MNYLVVTDFYHECLETIFELLQGAINEEYLKVFLDKGLIEIC